MIALTALTIIGGIAAGILLKIPPLTIMFAIVGIIWIIFAIILFSCWKEQFDASIVLLNVTGKYLRDQPSVFYAPLLVMLFSLFFFAFWIVSFIYIQLHRPADSFFIANNGQRYRFGLEDGLSIIWVFLAMFFSYFFQYVMVFLIATAVGLWYFNRNTENYLIKGLSNIVQSHIGSISFASMIVAVVSFLKSAASSKNNDDNGCAVVVQLLVQCCLSCIE